MDILQQFLGVLGGIIFLLAIAAWLFDKAGQLEQQAQSDDDDFGGMA